MTFYTNVFIKGNTIYYRGIDDNNERVATKESFSPTLFTTTNQPTNIKTLNGKSVVPKVFDNISEARDFTKEFGSTQGMEVHGFERWMYQYISDRYTNDIEYDATLVRKHNIDIEVKSDEGFPEPKDALHPVTLIQLLDSFTGVYHVWGCHEYKVHTDHIKIEYHRCKDEGDLLTSFLAYF